MAIPIHIEATILQESTAHEVIFGLQDAVAEMRGRAVAAGVTSPGRAKDITRAAALLEAIERHITNEIHEGQVPSNDRL